MKDLKDILGSAKGAFAPVVQVDEQEPGLVHMDFTERNTELTESILTDTDRFCDWVTRHIAGRKGKMGIGGYSEHRTIYRVSTLFDPEKAGEEPRTLHLGVDIWAPSGTKVHSPLAARVHSFSNQDRRGDYGAVIILEHELEGSTFFTLYGHLSKASLETAVGRELAKGENFACLGDPGENGQWPPHLHFQVMADLGGRSGDYPGVCKFSEKEGWLAICPDPDLILHLGHLAR